MPGALRCARCACCALSAPAERSHSDVALKVAMLSWCDLVRWDLPRVNSRLRGVPEAFILPMVSHLIARVGLGRYAHVACGTLSGGNKRKLALAAALVGSYPRLLRPFSLLFPEALHRFTSSGPLAIMTPASLPSLLYCPVLLSCPGG